MQGLPVTQTSASFRNFWLKVFVILVLFAGESLLYADDQPGETGITPVTVGVLANRDKEICHQEWE